MLSVLVLLGVQSSFTLEVHPCVPWYYSREGNTGAAGSHLMDAQARFAT
jgi:hypothetical protein